MAVKGWGSLFNQAILYILLLSTGFEAYRLNVPKLLLPYYSSVATNFTLEVKQGCFLWRSTCPEIAAVLGIGVKDASQCSSKASVSATSRVPSRKTAIVMAEDADTGQQLRCDVIVDDIEKIEIVTTTKELYLDDTPEEFEIRAINKEGDVFSSLGGMEFEWNLLPDDVKDGKSTVPAHSVLRFLKFSESNYEAPDFIKDLEEKGRRGDRILMRGVRTGSARISAKIVDQAYEHVKEDIVKIVVIANIQLNPSIVYLLQNTTVTYKVELLKQGRILEIPMPSQQYHLQVGDERIASLNSETSTATALEYGDTEVKLKDKNIKMTATFREPSAAIYVVTPGYLDFDIYPGRIWVLQTNKVYEIVINIYDKESHKIYPSSGIRVEATFPKEHFEVLSSTKNGTFHVVRTKHRGFTTLEGKLKAVVHVDGTVHQLTTAVEGSQEVEIYDSVSVVPKLVVLPWDPSAKMHYQYQLTAKGGSGNYTWVSEKTSIGTVTARGLLIASDMVGHSTITVSDVRNPAHYDTMEFYVLPPGELEFVPSRVEAELTSILELPLAVYAEFEGRKLKFDLCDFMPFTTSVKDAGVFKYLEVTKPSVPGSCASIKVEAKYLGHTDITTVYKYADQKLSAAVTIAAYKPLRAVDPEEIAVVTLAASKEITFEGGPQPWIVDPSGYYEKAQIEKPELLKMTSVKAYETRKNFHVFHVVCQNLGEQEIKLDVGNTPTNKNRFPANCSATIRFVCAEPKGLHLVPLVPQPTGLPPCPVKLDSDEPISAHCHLPLDISISVTDAEGRSFDNFSSLLIDWKLSDPNLGQFADGPGSVTTKLERTETGRRISRSYKTIDTKKKTGHMIVTASITKYDLKHFDNRLFDLVLSTPIKRKTEINFVKDAVIIPDYLTLYNHGTDIASLQLSHGSGHFHLEHSSGITVHHDEETRVIQVKPSQEGSFTVTAYDLCLQAGAPAEATIFVSDVYQIQLTVVDKVELGSYIVAQVQVRDRNNKAIPAKYFPVMKLKARLSFEIISVRPAVDKPVVDDVTAMYTVRGESLGRTSLQFEANQKSGKLVTSLPKDIQVFPPLRLEPRNITLIRGAIFQVTAHGGPQPESTIEFSIENDTVALVSSGGVIDTRQLGQTVVTGKAVGFDAESGYIVYSQDKVIVNVIELQGIKIHAPLKRLQAGTQMPVYAVGLNENEGPFSFASATPPLTFHWSISNVDVAQLQPVFYKSGIHPTAKNNFAVRFLASEAGHVTVHLKVTPDASSQLQVKDNTPLTDSIQIQVFDRLQVISPNICDGVFIMTPNTEAQIKTNRDGSSAKLSYTVIDHGIVHSSREPVILVGEGGHVTSYGRDGEANLLIMSQEDFGINQTLVILVKVKPVSYLMMNSDTKINTRDGRLSAVPVGSTLHFIISFHDNIGQPFYATNSKIKFRPNRYDLLQISYGNDNNTLIARATNVGHTVLEVWDQTTPHLTDYISINVDTAINPSDVLVTIGDIICFSSPIVGENGLPGSWLTNSVALNLNQHSGIGVATHVGKATVSYMPSALSTTHTYVTVVPISHVILKNEHLQYLTNVITKNRVGFVQVILESLKDKNGNGIHGHNCSQYIRDQEFSLWHLPFHCEVAMTTSHPHITVDDLVKVVNVFDTNTGHYQCQLNQQSGSPDLIQAISMLDTSIQLRAVVAAQDGQPEVSSSILSLPFVPAFYIHTYEIQLSNFVPKTHLRISAIERVLQDVKVTSSDETLVIVEAPEKTGQLDYLASYPVVLQLTSSLWSRSQLEVMIEVSCIATGQKQTVHVKIKLHGEQGTQVQQEITWSHIVTAITNNYQSILFMAFCIIATVSCMIIAYHAVIGQRYQAAANQSSVFMQSSPSPSQQLSHWASPQNVSHSPRHLWSVDTGPFEESGIFKRSPVR